MLTTDQKGAIAEMAIAWEATKLGIEVYRPMAEGGRFDMIFLLGNERARVQCKWASLDGEPLAADTTSGCESGPHGTIRGSFRLGRAISTSRLH
jgi:hypothetical protein